MVKGLIKVFYNGLAVFKEWRMIGLLEECVGSRLGQPQKRWIDSMNNCLKKRWLNVGQARRMVYDRNEWWEFVMRNSWGTAKGMKP